MTQAHPSGDGTALHARSGQAQPAPLGVPPVATVPTVTVNASADASAQGLSPAYREAQVARGSRRAGILGTRDNMETPFSITGYTNELMQDGQRAGSPPQQHDERDLPAAVGMAPVDCHCCRQRPGQRAVVRRLGRCVGLACPAPPVGVTAWCVVPRHSRDLSKSSE